MVSSPTWAATPGLNEVPATPHPARRTRGRTGRARTNRTGPLNTVAGRAAEPGRPPRPPGSAAAAWVGSGGSPREHPRAAPLPGRALDPGDEHRSALGLTGRTTGSETRGKLLG